MKNKKNSKMKRNRIVAGVIAILLVLSMVLGTVSMFLI